MFSNLLRFFSGRELINWLAPLGKSVRFLSMGLGHQTLRHLEWEEISPYCHWMGVKSVHFVSVSAVVVAIALTIQCVIELKRYQAEDLTGAAIAIGLLRELGPLTISVAWCARVSALISEEAKIYKSNFADEVDFARRFMMPRLVAALAMSVPLGAYGLLVGFITAGLFGPLLGVSSLNYFVQSARDAISDLDIIVYFTKLIAINPIIGVLAGAVTGYSASDPREPVAANAVTATFIGCLSANLAITVAAYLEGGLVQ